MVQYARHERTGGNCASLPVRPAVDADLMVRTRQNPAQHGRDETEEALDLEQHDQADRRDRQTGQENADPLTRSAEQSEGGGGATHCQSTAVDPKGEKAEHDRHGDRTDSRLAESGEHTRGAGSFTFDPTRPRKASDVPIADPVNSYTTSGIAMNSSQSPVSETRTAAHIRRKAGVWRAVVNGADHLRAG